MVEILGGELNFHKREVQMLRSEKESLESVLNTKTGEVRKTLGHELKKVEDEMKRHYAWQKSENSRIQQQVTGLKHSSLRRDLEWERLEVRDRVRPGFRLMTGNDLAIDLVVHGSDYLLGL
jgi:hypothetical protein